ncbi:signal peptidase I [Streptomyces sp. NBC_00091]|uniref:signal peptidase I n=1 Tax=Streptomyces sp. NBC_00091 TaxID=2975648 RepID=UPI00225B7445|nr:signal peptidase I [Streptomyces sp. NBC_00091]MCX5377377.1 signal peptidase I [Streptomyces sp. NBC_00091]
MIPSGAPPATAAEESWWLVLRMSGCRALVTMVTTLMCIPMAALAWGWSPSVVVSGSMEPALSRGDVVAVQHVLPSEVGGGAVIAYEDPDHGGRLTTHRAVKRLPEDAYLVKGDANPRPDPTPVTPDRLRGVVAVAVPWVGTVWLWLQQGDWAYLGCAVLLYAAALRGCVHVPGRTAWARCEEGRREE